MVTRLEAGTNGRLFAVVAEPAPGVEVGDRWLVVGNDLPVAELGIGWLGTRTCHHATVRERSQPPSNGRPGGHAHRAYPEEIKRQARDLRDQGFTYNGICEKLGGVPLGTVKLWLRSAQTVPKRRRGDARKQGYPVHGIPETHGREPLAATLIHPAPLT